MNLTRPFSLPLWTIAAPILACALLAACGGGGGDKATQTAAKVNKAEVTAVKQYVSSRVDRVREPFARRPA